MAVSKEKKVEIVNALKENFKNAKGVAFTENNWLSVEEITALRNEIRAANSTFMIAKKTLIKLAFKEVNDMDLTNDVLPGQIGIIFSNEDAIAGIGEAQKFIKKLEEGKIGWTWSYVDGELRGKEDTIKLSKLPGKDVLLAQFVWGLKAPLSTFVIGLKSKVSDLARLVKALQEEGEKKWVQTVSDLLKK